MDLQVAGRTYLVTCSSDGIGFAIARSFVEEGANVVINGREADKLAAARARLVSMAGAREVTTVQGDVTDQGTIERMLAACPDDGALGGAVLVTPGTRHGDWDSAQEEHWLDAFQGVVISAVRLLKGLVPRLHAAKGGSVLFVASASVLQPEAHLVVGNSVRPGVLGLSKTLAGRYGPENIRFNVLCPGTVKTLRYRTRIQRTAAARELTEQEVEDQIDAEIALRRVGDPAEVGAIAVFLSSPKGSYITGSVYAVDGGMHGSLL